jgi:sulfur carrier protein
MTGSLQINGQVQQFPPGQMPVTLSALVETLGIAAATVAAEVDGRIVKSDDFGRTALKDGQSVELIRFMGGG